MADFFVEYSGRVQVSTSTIKYLRGFIIFFCIGNDCKV